MPTVNLGRVRGSTIHLTHGEPAENGYPDDWAIDPDTGDLYYSEGEGEERPLDETVWKNFITSAGAYHEQWSGSAFIFSPFNDEVVRDNLLLRKDDSGAEVTAKELFAGNPDSGDLLIQTMTAIYGASNGGEYIDQGSYAMVKAPTWHQFQYALIHRSSLSTLPDEETCRKEAKNKYTWRYPSAAWRLVGNLKGPKGDPGQSAAPAGEVGA